MRAKSTPKAEETLHRLETLDADDPAFDDELAKVMAEIRHHIADEEGRIFAPMRQVIDREELRKLGARVEAQEGGTYPAAPQRPERAARPDRGRSAGIAVRPHARPRDRPRDRRLSACATAPGAGHRPPASATCRDARARSERRAGSLVPAHPPHAARGGAARLQMFNEDGCVRAAFTP
jgi:hypothetical protein